MTGATATTMKPRQKIAAPQAEQAAFNVEHDHLLRPASSSSCSRTSRRRRSGLGRSSRRSTLPRRRPRRSATTSRAASAVNANPTWRSAAAASFGIPRRPASGTAGATSATPSRTCRFPSNKQPGLASSLVHHHVPTEPSAPNTSITGKAKTSSSAITAAAQAWHPQAQPVDVAGTDFGTDSVADLASSPRTTCTAWAPARPRGRTLGGSRYQCAHAARAGL